MSKITGFDEFDLNDVATQAEELGFDPFESKFWRPVNQLIINDPEHGGSPEDYLTAYAGGVAPEEDEAIDYNLVDAITEGTLLSVNRALKAARSGLEIKRVDLGDYGAFMLVNTDESPEQFVQRVYVK